MTVEEIFQGAAAHMARGVAIHDQLATAFGFLNLNGYQRAHEHHFVEEAQNYRALQDFYLTSYHKMVEVLPPQNPQIIPQNWFKYTKFDVDINSKRDGIKNLVKKWIDWEKETKKLWETYHKELYGQNEIYASLYMAKLIEDVSEELKGAENLLLNLEAINYDMSKIIEDNEGDNK